MRKKSGIINFRAFFAHFGSFLIVLILTLSLINFTYFFLRNNEQDSLITQQTSHASEDLSISKFIINSTVTTTFDDLFIIRDSKEFTNYINAPDPTTLSEAQQLFYRIALNKDELLQIRFINTDGLEVIRVNNIDGTPVIVPETELQDK